MEIAKGFIVPTPEFKHFSHEITPGEALIVKEMHNSYSNGKPLEGLTVTGIATRINEHGKPVLIEKVEVKTEKVEQVVNGRRVKVDADVEVRSFATDPTPRTNAEECNRLRRKYTGHITKGGQTLTAFTAVFGTAAVVNLPQTFDEIRDIIGEVSYPAGFNRKIATLPATADAPVREDGPTFEQYVEAGYQPATYPPPGYQAKDSPGLQKYRASIGVGDQSTGEADPKPKKK